MSDNNNTVEVDLGDWYVFDIPVEHVDLLQQFIVSATKPGVTTQSIKTAIQVLKTATTKP